MALIPTPLNPIPPSPKSSKNWKMRPCSESTKIKISISMKQYLQKNPRSKEIKRKMSEAAKERFSREGEAHPLKTCRGSGTPCHTEESKRKISEAVKKQKREKRKEKEATEEKREATEIDSIERLKENEREWALYLDELNQQIIQKCADEILANFRTAP